MPFIKTNGPTIDKCRTWYAFGLPPNQIRLQLHTDSDSDSDADRDSDSGSDGESDSDANPDSAHAHWACMADVNPQCSGAPIISTNCLLTTTIISWSI